MSERDGTILTKPGAAAVAALLALSAAPALAQGRQDPQQSASPIFGLFNANQARNPARYATPDGAVQFVFDPTYGRAALVRFEGDREVHALRPRMGPNGNEIYTTDDGDVRLVFTPHGGIIVFTDTLETGAPVSMVSRAAPLTLADLAFARFQARLRQLQAEFGRRIGREVTFEAPMQTNRPVPGVVLDAAERAAEGIAEAPLTTVRHVVITVGPAPRAVLQGDRLIVQVAPQMGYAGRPSSARIRAVVTGATQGPER